MNEKMKIVVLDGFAGNPGDLSWAPLEALGQCTVYDRTAPQQVIARAADAQIILTNKVVMSRDVIEALPHLKYIGVIATGYNIIDLDAARELHAVNLRASALDLLHNADDIARPACVQTHPEVVARLLNHLMEAHAAQANGDVSTHAAEARIGDDGLADGRECLAVRIRRAARAERAAEAQGQATAFEALRLGVQHDGLVFGEVPQGIDGDGHGGVPFHSRVRRTPARRVP